MSESLLLSTWNVHRALSDPERFEATLQAISNSKADVIALPDAWHEDAMSSSPDRPTLLATPGHFKAIGYKAVQSVFHEPRPEDAYVDYGFMTLIREGAPIIDTQEVTIGKRPFHHLTARLGEQTITLISLYLSDVSEALRLEQTEQTLHYLDTLPDDPTILLGDFNAMHEKSTSARLLRSKLARNTLGRVTANYNLFPRLIEMASGDTLQRFETDGFEDAEQHFLATVPARLPIAQLDHIMSRNGTGSGLSNPLHVDQPIRIQQADLSDHLQLITTVKVQ